MSNSARSGGSLLTAPSFLQGSGYTRPVLLRQSLLQAQLHSHSPTYVKGSENNCIRKLATVCLRLAKSACCVRSSRWVFGTVTLPTFAVDRRPIEDFSGAIPTPLEVCPAACCFQCNLPSTSLALICLDGLWELESGRSIDSRDRVQKFGKGISEPLAQPQGKYRHELIGTRTSVETR